jgi:hypothetical protein
MDIGLIQDFHRLGIQDFLSLNGFSHSLVSGSIWIAQVVKDDLFNNVGQSWNNFIQSGQVWALVIGFVLGYLFRSITS